MKINFADWLGWTESIITFICTILFIRMILRKFVTLVAAFLLFGSVTAQFLSRTNSFVGFHFDFHASIDDKEIGKTFTAGMIDSFLEMTRPDYIQVDCKGHPGYSSYPTKVGNQAGGYTKDILKIWREETEKYHVALFVHYSGLWDQKAMTDHPEWARIRADGTPDNLKASYLGAYPDKLLIPQLKELSGVYHIDGAWVDGDCWAAQPDYSPAVLKLFTEKTGITQIPRSPADSAYPAFVDFNRGLFRAYVRKYVDAIHAYNPNFQITSNWSFSSMMPEKVDINVDFLSGDVAGQNCVYNSAFQARCLALQGKPWDLMAWSFTYSFDDQLMAPKSLIQLEQEAAEVMAMGGGFQSYWTQNRDGSIKPWNFKEMAELASFCRARQPYCQHSTIIPQIGLWYSTESWKLNNSNLYSGGTDAIEQILAMLLDDRRCVEILMDHQLVDCINKYPLIILPEWTHIGERMKTVVLDYVKQGGNVLILGSSAVKEFESYLGVVFKEQPAGSNIFIGMDNEMSQIKTSWQAVVPDEGTQTIGRVFETGDFRFPSAYPVASVKNYGKGKIAGIYMNLGFPYYHYQAPVIRHIVDKTIEALFPHPFIRVTGSDYVHVVLSEKEDKEMVHLINTAGSHFNKQVYVYNEIPATGELTVEIRSAHELTKATLQPGGLPLKIVANQGMYTIKVPPVKIHAIIQLELKK